MVMRVIVECVATAIRQAQGAARKACGAFVPVEEFIISRNHGEESPGIGNGAGDVADLQRTQLVNMLLREDKVLQRVMPCAEFADLCAQIPRRVDRRIEQRCPAAQVMGQPGCVKAAKGATHQRNILGRETLQRLQHVSNRLSRRGGQLWA